MKLRTKLTVLSVLLLAAAITICCAFTLKFAGQNATDRIRGAGIGDYEEFYELFAGKIRLDNEMSAPALQSYLRYLLTQQKGSDEYTLQMGEEPIANAIGIDAPATVSQGTCREYTSPSLDVSLRYATAKSGEQTYFLVTGELPVGNRSYQLSLIRDISDTSNALAALTIKCIFVGIGTTIAAAVCMLLIIRYSLHPIRALKDAAGELSRGHYEKRIAVEGRDELSELAGDFNRMADTVEAGMEKLREKTERQQTFINDLSHELKTPITSILLNAETLLGRKVDPKIDDAGNAARRNPLAGRKRRGTAGGGAGKHGGCAPQTGHGADHRLQYRYAPNGFRSSTLGRCEPC
jgi:HAMP domain-containing protein